MSDIFNTQLTFADLGLSPAVLSGVNKAGFVHPTIVQARLIPMALAGRDIIGQSKTGTGKTAAFGLPLLHLLSESDHFGALVLVPTRELAIQVAHEIRELGRFTSLKDVAVYGGQKMSLQINKLQKRPNIIVGTPGRVMDMHQRGFLPYDQVKVAILDEVDRMLDIGFRDDIRKILGTMKHPHQTIFVSATISAEIEKLAHQYLRNPERLTLTESKSLTVSQVTQRYFPIQPWDKNRLLVHLLTHEEPALTLVFCRTKHTVDALTDYLNRHKIDAHSMHGDMYQGKRNRVMQKLRDGELSVLVASDLAARGLDVDDITHVINYDLPEDPENYVHRIGRTARTGKDGIAWSFVTPDQGDLLTAIEMLTNVEIPIEQFKDFQPGPVPADVAIQRERAAARAEQVRVEQSRVAAPPPALVGDRDQGKFPGGLVPSARPSRSMGGRLRSRRR
ncbi:MAG: DEAD/DEAH box helicase [Phycisphaerales bacterium]|nr:DEAD/DEAH box helicase [Phycisphaerales bacterium]MCI0631297.1 DEAD/DEAH box helicase [Phycisphaerales bacterium]MCI0675281.1 DEAD/DEAH box helicase [Phycisphaerales bacterium]